MKTLFIVGILFTISLSYAKADDLKPEALSPCEEAACFIIAPTIAIQEKPNSNRLKVRINSIVLYVPPNINRLDVGKSLIIFRYETAPHVMVSTETDDVFKIFNISPSQFSLLRALEIIFTKTAREPSIRNKYNSELLNKLMWIKKGLLQRSGEAYVYEKGRIKIYYVANAGPTYRNLAWAIDSEYPNTATRIESDLSVTDFTSILYSISVGTKEQ